MADRIILPKAGTVIPPQGTDLEIFQDTDGSIKSVNSSGVKTAIGGGGGGSVASVTGVAAGIVDNTDPANPVVQAQFGSDTTVQVANAASALVDALELIASLTTSTAGAEVSQWAIKLLSAGSKVTSYVLGALGLTVPAGSTAVPSINFAGDATSGMYRQNTGDLRLIDRAFGCLSWNNITGIQNLVNGGGFFWANAVGTYQGGPNSANLIATGASIGNVEIGPAGALATNATAGFLGLPTCAGTPSGTPANVSSGKVCALYDTTAHKIWVFDGAWKSTAALT